MVNPDHPWNIRGPTVASSDMESKLYKKQAMNHTASRIEIERYTHVVSRFVLTVNMMRSLMT